MVTKTGKPNRSKTLLKAIQILELFSLDNPDFGVREVANTLKINPSSAYRLISTLSDEGYLEQNPSTRRYSLGPGVLKLAWLYNNINPIPNVAQRVFEEYATVFEHSFFLIFLASKYEAVYLYVREGRSPLRITKQPGSITYLHSTAGGKVLLAYQSEYFVEDFMKSHEFTPLTQRTITSPKIFRETLSKVRLQGYAINDGEQFDDIGAIAVPIIELSGQVRNCVSLAYPRHHMLEGRLEFDRVLNCAQDIANQIMERLYSSEPQRP
jgi:DNA-binding IclR family transcriptional regulator